jgi:hypothetical protein
MKWEKQNISDKLYPIVDDKMNELKNKWFLEPQREVLYPEFVPLADQWFRSSSINDIQGWESFKHIDVTMGCTHYIESFILKHGWDGFQLLKNEYAYYTLMGKHGVEAKNLEPNKPLLITIPHWNFCDVRPEWPDILRICEQRNIDIHIDMAWMITARDIQLDLDHACVKSVGMSMSKYGLKWNRIGLRWSRQKTMDSITIYNDYYIQTNTILTSVGAYFMERLPRDYVWSTHGDSYYDLCDTLDIEPTKIIHVAKDKITKKSLGIGHMFR